MEGWLRSAIDETADTVADTSGGASSWLTPTFVLVVASVALLVGVSLWWLARHGAEIHRPDDDPSADADQ
jgi:hypothetical protein